MTAQPFPQLLANPQSGSSKANNATQHGTLVKPQNILPCELQRPHLILFGKSSLLADKSPLFNHSLAGYCSTKDEFVRAVNCLVASHKSRGATSRPPKTLDKSISSKGEIKDSTEVLHFGNWLLINGKSGSKPAPGKKPDDLELLRTVAAVAAELLNRERLIKIGQLGKLSKSTTSPFVTDTDLRKRWAIMYRDYQSVSWFKSRPKAATRILEQYLDYISQKNSGKRKLTSPLLKKTLKAMKPRKKEKPAALLATKSTSPAVSGVGKTTLPSTSTPQITPPVPAPSLSPLDFRLEYSSDTKRDQYRSTAPISAPASSLRYSEVPAEIFFDAKKLPQARFRDKIVYVPQVTLKGSIKVKAVIDRMFLIFTTREVTAGKAIHDALKVELSEICYADDLVSGRNSLKWGSHIEIPPEMNIGYGDGRVFALLIQEPNPEKFTKILDIIKGKWGIVGNVRPFLMEFSLDFYPNDKHDPITSIRLREQMVGLLQRHHHFEKLVFKTPKADARQFYQQIGKSGDMKDKTDNLFSKPRNTVRLYPDTDISRKHVRKRLHHGRKGNQLYLDATLYKGTQSENLLFSTQHKTEDARNPKTGTHKILDDKERRARIEVEISGYEYLAEDLGLKEISDMKGFTFRKVRKKYLRFWLPTSSHDPDEKIMVRNQLKDRGIYGIELAKQLSGYEAKMAAKKINTPSADKTRNRTGTGNTGERVAWEECNEAVGKALDALSKTWRSFDWKN